MFQLNKHSTEVSREIVAGVTTFAAMSYILVVNPGMLSLTGMDPGALLTATALAAAVGTLLMAFLTNYPVALAPGMGLNAFFTFTICDQLDVPWEGALAMVFWTGILFLILSVTPFRREVVKAIPPPLKTGIQAGIGLFIITIAFKGLGIVSDPAPDFPALRLAPFQSALLVPLGMAGLGCVVAAILLKRKVAGALLISIALISLLGAFITAKDLLFQPRRSVTAHCPGLEGVQGEEGVKEPH